MRNIIYVLLHLVSLRYLWIDLARMESQTPLSGEDVGLALHEISLLFHFDIKE